jgi:hypothetical protein
MKKFFEEAELEIVKFENEDIITTSDVELPPEPSDPVEVPGDEF